MKYNYLKLIYHDSDYHLEQDVYTHTMMVLNSILNDIKEPRLRKIMFFTALSHDMGKIQKTEHGFTRVLRISVGEN